MTLGDKVQEKKVDLERAFASGEPGTTGREPFEDSTATGPGAQFAGSTGNTSGGLTHDLGGEHSHHSGHHDRQHHHDATSAGGLTGAAETATGHHGHGHSGGYSGVGEHNSGSLGGIANVGNTGSGFNENESRREGALGQSGNTRVEDATQRGKEFTGLSGAGAGAGEHGHHSHHAHHGKGAGLTGRDTGRVGDLNQEAHKYESTGAGGPKTSGAAGTDRFDTDRTKSSTTDSTLGKATGYGEKIEDDKSLNKEAGGGLNPLTTSDKDFVDRDRLGKGAYNDDHAAFKDNKSGPGGNTALTGREGTKEENPVAQAKSKVGQDVYDNHGAGASEVGRADHPEQHKGIMEKIKDALH